MAADFAVDCLNFTVAFDRSGKLLFARASLNGANRDAAYLFPEESGKTIKCEIKRAARVVGLAHQLPGVQEQFRASLVNFNDFVRMINKAGVSYDDLDVLFKNDVCYLLPLDGRKKKFSSFWFRVFAAFLVLIVSFSVYHFGFGSQVSHFFDCTSGVMKSLVDFLDAILRLLELLEKWRAYNN